MSTPAEDKLTAVVLTLRAIDRRIYNELVEALHAVREQYRDKAIAGHTDNSLFLAVGFARGVAEIHRLVRDASILSAPQPNPGSQ